MKDTFVPVRPEGDIKRKVTFSVNPLHCVGVVPHEQSKPRGKVLVSTIEIVSKKGLRENVVELRDVSSNCR